MLGNKLMSNLEGLGGLGGLAKFNPSTTGLSYGNGEPGSITDRGSYQSKTNVDKSFVSTGGGVLGLTQGAVGGLQMGGGLDNSMIQNIMKTPSSKRSETKSETKSQTLSPESERK